MSQENQVLESKIKSLETKLVERTAERDEYKELYISVCKKNGGLVLWAEQLQELVTKYQKWFAYNAHWTNHHNRMIQFNPDLGYPMIKGGKPRTYTQQDKPELSTVDALEEVE